MRTARSPMRTVTFRLPVEMAAAAQARAQAEGRSLGNYLRRVLQAAQEQGRGKDPATARKPSSPDNGA